MEIITPANPVVVRSNLPVQIVPLNQNLSVSIVYRGPPGETPSVSDAQPFLSTNEGNSATTGTDGGIYVQVNILSSYYW